MARLVLMIVVTCWTLHAGGDPLASDQSAYSPGDEIDLETFFLDQDSRRVKLRDAMSREARVVVLVVFGGAYLHIEGREAGIWCSDSLDEFSNLKAAANSTRDKGAQFIAVACPPVYSEGYGFDPGVFLDEPEASPRYRTAVRQFIAKTEALRANGTIPFEQVYYDPRFRLLWNPRQHPFNEAYGKVHPWQGRLKWHQDNQRYGTPTIWFLSSTGRVLRSPLYGNNYSTVPPKIRFTFWELEGAILEELSRR